ncbi:MAG: CDP-diacylglycerol--serine O-phosphatidyltransferase [Cyclobacteriaceae bacterium]|nr:CDP-diacylglycerol--serine O-phosphatidyltransferase [Cyclobacteriaceae bacterium]
MSKFIPNLLTLLNLISGCLGIVMVFDKGAHEGLLFILIAVFFDFFDGFSARLLKVKSDMGKELDSLADMVSFGILPAIIMFHLLKNSSDIFWLPYISFLLAAFSALRLAKFNIDERQAEVFYGLPTPSNALFIASLSFINFVQTPVYLVIITLLFSLLMVVDIPLFALKFKSFRWQGNEVRMLFLLFSLVLISFLQVAAIPIIICLYVLTSVILNVFRVKDSGNKQ